MTAENPPYRRLKFLHVSDGELVETKDDKWYQTVAQIAKEQRVDAVFLTGDIVKAWPQVDIWQGGMGAIIRQLASYLTHEKQEAWYANMVVSQNGGIERLRAILKAPDLDDANRHSITDIVNLYDRTKRHIAAANEEMRHLEEANSEQIEKVKQKLYEKILETSRKKLEHIDDIFKKTGVKVFAVHGNHDIQHESLYKNLKAMTFVDRVKPFDYKGVRIAGLSGVDVNDNPGHPDDLVPHLFEDPSTADLERIVEEEGVPENTVEKKLLEESELYARLKKEPIDVLLTHKMPYDFTSERNKDDDEKVRSFPHGLGVAQLIKEKSPTVFGGHLAQAKAGTSDEGFTGFRATQKTGFLLEYDVKQRRVVGHATVDLRDAA